MNAISIQLSQTPINWDIVIKLLNALPSVSKVSPSSPVNTLTKPLFIDSKNDNNNDKKDGYYGKTCLQLALKEKRKDVILLAIDKGCHINESKRTLNQDERLLNVCIENNWIDVVDQLVKKNVDLKERDENNLTPLHIACKLNREEIIKLMLNKNTSSLWIDEYIKITSENGDIKNLFYQYFSL